MNEIPKISIIVPIYKVPEKYLRVCIESCQKQTLKEIEILLVADYDKEPDESTFICHEYAKKDKRFVMVHKENGGLGNARNVGQDAAQGTVVTIVELHALAVAILA